MTMRLLLTFLAIGTLLSSGCLFSGRKHKESSALATQTEQDFKTRWTTRRVSELTAQGVAESAAKQQAENEFQEKYKFAIPQK